MFDMVWCIAGVDLLIRIARVIYEFNLSKQLDFSKVISEGFTESMDNRFTILRKNAAEAVTSSCEDPSSNTHSDFVILSTYYNAEVDQLKCLRILDLVTDFWMRWVDVTASKLFNLLSTNNDCHGTELFLKNHHYLKETGGPILAESSQCEEFFDEFVFRASLEHLDPDRNRRGYKPR